MTDTVDYSQLYRNACAVAACRANSAVLRLLSASPSTPPTELPLSNTYVGPKGIGPILALIENCQTIEKIDLRGNGLDNRSIERLCEVLKRHLGVMSLKLSDNPITQDGGKYLMSLVESNKRITDLELEKTHLFDSLVQRLMQAVAENAGIPATKLVRDERPKKLVQTDTPSRTALSSAPGEIVTVRVPLKPEGPITPRPPHPAIASAVCSRMSATQREEAKAKYEELKRITNVIAASEASRAANNARYQLMMLEAADRRQKLQPGPMASPAPAPPTQPPLPEPAQEPGPERSASLPEEPPEEIAPPREDTAPKEEYKGEPIQTNEAGRTVVYSKDPEVAPFVVPATREQAFKELFDAGCVAYKNMQLDEAYLKWNDAMNFAVEHKNREWIAIITNNLQRLSYEILVAEGMRHMEASRLKEADEAFAQAIDVAKKAKNSSWEADMLKARKNVQHGVFQRAHEQATQQFEQALRHNEGTVTEEEQFVSPDGQGLVMHSSSFYNEWQRMLYIKEAMEGWVDASAVAKHITGPSSRVLQDIVTSSVVNVSQYLMRLYYAERLNIDSATLPRQGASNYTYDEADQLLKLWIDIIGKTDILNNHLFNTVAYAQMGHLSLALNQVKRAVKYFREVANIGEILHDPVISACGLTYLGITFWQMSEFGEAERCLNEALEDWAKLQEYLRRERNGALENGTEAVSSGPFPSSSASGDAQANANICDSPFFKAIPHEVLNALHSSAYSTLVVILIAVHRHHEALEMLEMSLHTKYNDSLSDKLKTNFTAIPTMDHIISVAASLKTPLVYLNPSVRFEWDADASQFTALQQLHIWIIPPEGEMKFVTVDVTRDYQVPSIMDLVGQVRDMLYVKAIGDEAVGGLIETLPEVLWKTPLQTLYDIIVDPMLGFLSAHAGYSDQAVLTLIPVGQLWAVPFMALMDRRTDKFFIEQFALQMSYGAVHCYYCSLNSIQSLEHAPKKNIIVMNEERENSELNLQKYHLIFPIDHQRSLLECERIREILARGQSAEQELGRKPDESKGIITEQNLIITDIAMLREKLPLTRYCHFSAPVSSTAAGHKGSRGAICLSSSHDLEPFHSADVASLEIFAQAVTLSNTNIDVDLLAGPREGVMLMIRAFITAGCPSVIAALWCTPDMAPYRLFELFYAFHLEPQRITPSNALPAAMVKSGQPASSARQSRGGGLPAPPSHKPRNKALSLALAVRELLKDDAYRYAPRHWAPYFLVGTGE